MHAEHAMRGGTGRRKPGKAANGQCSLLGILDQTCEETLRALRASDKCRRT